MHVLWFFDAKDVSVSNPYLGIQAEIRLIWPHVGTLPWPESGGFCPSVWSSLGTGSWVCILMGHVGCVEGTAAWWVPSIPPEHSPECCPGGRIWMVCPSFNLWTISLNGSSLWATLCTFCGVWEHTCTVWPFFSWSTNAWMFLSLSGSMLLMS